MIQRLDRLVASLVVVMFHGHHVLITGCEVDVNLETTTVQ
jgi:hypothetical protein